MTVESAESVLMPGLYKLSPEDVSPKEFRLIESSSNWVMKVESGAAMVLFGR